MGRFIYYFLFASVLFVVFHALFAILFRHVPLVASLLDIAAIILLLHFLSYVFDDARHKEVFQYNYYLFLLAIALFIAGALVETFVIGNAAPLHRVYLAAAGF